MKSIQQQWLHGTLLLCLYQSSMAFQPRSISQKRQATSLKAIVDPNDIASAASSLSHPELPALMSTMLSTALQPAHGHSNPLFGSPDPILEAGKSLAPSARAIANMGITHAKSVSEMIPDTSLEFQQKVGAALKQGWKVLDNSDLTGRGGEPLPGFSPTKAILATRTPAPDSPESFAAEVKWAAGYFNVMDKLPFAAFWYAMVEFFILRPNVDLYKEDIEADPLGVTADTVSVAAVRCLAIAIIAIVTVGIYG
jgi:hypothetical protein